MHYRDYITAAGERVGYTGKRKRGSGLLRGSYIPNWGSQSFSQFSWSNVFT